MRRYGLHIERRPRMYRHIRGSEGSFACLVVNKTCTCAISVLCLPCIPVSLQQKHDSRGQACRLNAATYTSDQWP